MSRNTAKGRGGFTIVELLIVVVVIAILAAITIVSYNGITKQAREAAMLSEVAQVQKSMQVDAALQGIESSIKAPLVYARGANKVTPLTRPLTATQEVTMYLVFDTTGSSGTDYTNYMVMLPYTTTPGNIIGLRYSHSNGMGSRMDTSAQANATTHFTASAGLTTGRNVGWVTAKAERYDVNYNSSSLGQGASLLPHSGWNFDKVSLRGGASMQAVAGLVFAEWHDEPTRKQVLQWLDKEYSIGFYNE